MKTTEQRLLEMPNACASRQEFVRWMNAIHEESSVQGLAVVCSSLLGYSALLFYIDQPRPN